MFAAVGSEPLLGAEFDLWPKTASSELTDRRLNSATVLCNLSEENVLLLLPCPKMVVVLFMKHLLDQNAPKCNGTS